MLSRILLRVICVICGQFLFALGPLPLLDSASIAFSKRMSSKSEPSRVLYHNLDTSFVNLWGLLRYLSQRSFIGRVHVELESYTADVFLNGSKTPLVHEVDLAAGSDVGEEAALHRLVCAYANRRARSVLRRI